MRFRVISIAVVLVLACGSALYSDPSNPLQGKRPVKLGPAADVSTSAVTRQVLKGNMQQLGPSTRTLAFEIDPAACAVYPAPEGYEYLKVNDLKPTARKRCQVFGIRFSAIPRCAVWYQIPNSEDLAPRSATCGEGHW